MNKTFVKWKSILGFVHITQQLMPILSSMWKIAVVMVNDIYQIHSKTVQTWWSAEFALRKFVLKPIGFITNENAACIRTCSSRSIVIEVLTNRKQTILRFWVVFVDFPALDLKQPPTGRMIYAFARRMGCAALSHLFNDFRPV